MKPARRPKRPMNREAGMVTQAVATNWRASGSVASAGLGASELPTSAVMVMESAMQLMPSAWQTARTATLPMPDRVAAARSCAMLSMAAIYAIVAGKPVRLWACKAAMHPLPR